MIINYNLYGSVKMKKKKIIIIVGLLLIIGIIITFVLLNRKYPYEDENTLYYIEYDNEILRFERIELTNNTCDILLQFFAMAFRELYKENVQYVDNHFIGLDYDEKDKIILSQFEKLSYNEKLDVISELVIRYNNNSMFKNQEIHIPFNDDVDGFEWARLIQKLKI